jgi:ATP-dependent DNA helicase RecG
MDKLRIFLSSVQKELAGERRAVKAFIRNDPLLSRFTESVFLFEDLPAADRLPDDIYLSEVEGCDIYLAIFGNEYGWKNADGLSPTELEFDCATRTHRERLVFGKTGQPMNFRKWVPMVGREDPPRPEATPPPEGIFPNGWNGCYFSRSLAFFRGQKKEVGGKRVSR